MKKEIRTKTVEYEVYVAKDGEEFETEKDCILYEKRLDGLIKDCEACNGTGEIRETYEDVDYHSGAPIELVRYRTCPKCNGKGYLEKKLKEVWE